MDSSGLGLKSVAGFLKSIIKFLVRIGVENGWRIAVKSGCLLNSSVIFSLSSRTQLHEVLFSLANVGPISQLFQNLKKKSIIYI